MSNSYSYNIIIPNYAIVNFLVQKVLSKTHIWHIKLCYIEDQCHNISANWSTSQKGIFCIRIWKKWQIHRNRFHSSLCKKKITLKTLKFVFWSYLKLWKTLQTQLEICPIIWFQIVVISFLKVIPIGSISRCQLITGNMTPITCSLLSVWWICYLPINNNYLSFKVSIIVILIAGNYSTIYFIIRLYFL